jgi:ribosomal protein S18 acetylase RimI-like enzyme
MEDGRPFRVGDRIEWIGPSVVPPPHFPRHGERGWLVMIDPMDDIVVWDEAGTDTGAYTQMPYVRRVGDRNEPDPDKWLPGDPFGPGKDDETKPRLTVDRAQPSDAAAAEALLDAAAIWQQSRGIRMWTPGWFGDEVRETIANGDLYVARRGGVTVGCFLLEPGCPEWMAPWLIQRGREPGQGAHLGRLTVAREATGRRLGIALLNVASTLAAQQGLAYVRLDCPAENARLRRYYVDAGFSYLGDIGTQGPAGERWVSSVFERATGP